MNPYTHSAVAAGSSSKSTTCRRTGIDPECPRAPCSHATPYHPPQSAFLCACRQLQRERDQLQHQLLGPLAEQLAALQAQPGLAPPLLPQERALGARIQELAEELQV